MTEFQIFVGEGKLTLKKLQTAFFAIEKNRERVVTINLTHLDFDDIRIEAICSVDFTLHYVLGERHSKIGTLYGAQVLVDRNLKESYIVSNYKNIYRLKMLQEEVPKHNVKMKFIVNNI